MTSTGNDLITPHYSALLPTTNLHTPLQKKEKTRWCGEKRNICLAKSGMATAISIACFVVFPTGILYDRPSPLMSKNNFIIIEAVSLVAIISCLAFSAFCYCYKNDQSEINDSDIDDYLQNCQQKKRSRKLNELSHMVIEK